MSFSYELAGIMHSNHTAIWPTAVMDTSVASKEAAETLLAQLAHYRDASGTMVPGCAPPNSSFVEEGIGWAHEDDAFLLRRALFTPYGWALCGLAGMCMIVVAGVHSLSRIRLPPPPTLSNPHQTSLSNLHPALTHQHPLQCSRYCTKHSYEHTNPNL